ncbi:dynamin family protein [Helicobacter sp. T3_23-1056]
MLQTQQNFVDYLGQLDSLAQKARLDKDKSKLITSIKERELLIPVVGGFSAGKSSALNDFLGEEILSVAITPETALATELRYTAGQSYAEGVKDNDSVEKIAISNLDSLKNRAGEFKYLRLYLNNPKLQAIEPLILVDMPGFDAPLELHHKAITEYLQRGIYFIILESAESGTIAMSIKKHIDSLQTLGRDFSFCLSKVDLVAPSTLEGVKNKIASILSAEFGYDKEMALLGNNSSRGEVLQQIIKQINAEQVFENLYLDTLKFDFNDTKSSLQTKISSLKSTKDEADEALKELQNAIDSIVNKKQNIAQNITSDIQSAVDGTMIAVDKAIQGSISSIAQSALSNPQSLNAQVSEIVRSTLLNEFTRRGGKMRENLIADYKFELKDLNVASLNIDSAWVENVANSINTALHNISVGVTDNSGLIEGVASAIESGASILAKTPALKWLPIVATIVTGLLRLFAPERKIDEGKLLMDILQSVRSTITPEVSSAYSNQISAMQEIVGDLIESKLKEKQDEIKKAQEEKSQKADKLNAEIEDLSAISSELDSLAKKYIFK